MAKTTIEIDLKVKGEQSVGQVEEKAKSLKAQLKEMKALLASGTLDSDQFKKLSIEAGQLQDRIADVNQRVKNLASDSRRLDAVVNVAQGIVGGFTAVQGVMALVGDENEDLQRTLLKVQGAMAALNGLQAVANTLNKDSAASTILLGNANIFTAVKTGTLTAANTLYTFVTNGATVATKAFRAALLATGIGAVVVLVGTLVSAMSDLSDSTDEATKKQKEHNDELERRRELNKEDAEQYVKDRNIKAGGLNDMERELALLKAKGATAEEIYNKETAIRKKERDDINYQIGYNFDNEKQLSDLQQQLRDNDNAQKVADAEFNKQLEDKQQKRREENAAKNKKLREEQRAAEQQAEADRLRKLNDANKERDEIEKESLLRTLNTKDREVVEAQLKYTEKFKLFVNDAETTKLLTEQMNQDIAAINQKYRDEENAKIKEAQDKQLADRLAYDKAVEQAEWSLVEAKRGALDAGFNIAQQFAGKNKALADTLFVIQKGVAIANIIVDTQKEIAGYWSNPTWKALPDGGVTLATSATAAAKVRAATSIATIAATTVGKFMNGGGGASVGGGSSTSGGGVGSTASAPGINRFTPTTTSGGQSSQRVYVLEKDITDSQGRVAKIRHNATLI